MPNEPTDGLVESGSVSSVVIFNYGDPAYRHRADATRGLHGAEAIFLRLIAYLVFAERVSVPVRHILAGDDMAQAVVWSASLLEEGILVPERRAESASFEDLARLRHLPALGRQRAAFLDRHARQVRYYHHQNLSDSYLNLLNEDLADGGGFRRTVPGGIKGKYAAAITAAHEEHQRTGDGMPEIFTACVAKYAPTLRAHALRWAMARYYTTPLLFDSLNTREVPASAAELLIKGGVLDRSLKPFEKAAPADTAFQRLTSSVPANSISVTYRQYCETLLEVRQRLPEARRIFADIRKASQLKDAGDSLSDLFAQELARQQRVLPGSGRLFTLVSSLAGGVAGLALSLTVPGSDLTLGLGLGIGSGIAGNEMQNRLRGRKDRNERPWVLAMDHLDRKTPNK